MSQVTVDLVEGWSGAVDFRLLAGGSSQNLAGFTVTGQGYNRLGVAVDLSSDVVISSATSGLVRLTPDTEDFTADKSPYELRFKATDGSGIVFFPSAEPIVIVVRR